MTALIIDYVLLKGIYEEVHFTLVLKCANLFHDSAVQRRSPGRQMRPINGTGDSYLHID